MSDYDVIVVGQGAPGEHCAARLAEGGAKVAVVERELVGGECSYWACIPSKTLLRPGEALQAAREAPGATTGELDAEAVLAWRDFQVSSYDDSNAAGWLKGEGIDLFRGEGRLLGGGRVAAGDRELSADHVVIATGSEPRIPPIFRDVKGIWTNREATGLKEVPRRLVVVGAGPVGVEMAQAVRRMGGEVVLVNGSDRVLPREPRRLGEKLGEALAGDGIDIRFGVRAESARRDGEDYVLELDDGSSVRGDRLLVATGRGPRTAGLGLEEAGVRLGERGEVQVDSRMSAGDGLWAVGDVTGIWPLTYVGKYQGRVAAANILGGHAEASYDAVPRVVFTDPQAASVGAAEGEREVTVELSSVARTSTYTREYAERPGFMTLVADGERLTGAYALGPEAGEWLQQATLAIRARVPLAVMADTIQPFPTFSEAFMEAMLELGAPAAG